MKIVIIAFNYAHAGKIVNGPGMCLENFSKILRIGGHKASIFTKLPCKKKGIYSIKNSDLLSEKLKKADLFIHWSGIDFETTQIVKLANLLGKKVILGPNLIDTVEYKKETNFLAKVSFDKIITVNERLKYLIMQKYHVPLDKLGVLMVGPNLDLWSSVPENDGTILWKGNSSHFVKDVKFALELQKMLPYYKFKFIGYPKPYDYYSHIKNAKKSKLYISTSLSETMGLGLLEQWTAGIPSVTHPKIYMHGINYFTGIITNRTLEDYADAIEEIMENDDLYKQLSLGAQKFVAEKFSVENTLREFNKIVS